MQAGDLQGEQVEAGRNAGAALRHDLRRGRAGHQGQIFSTQHRRGLEAAVGFEVVLEEAVARAGNVAADGVDGFVFATEAIGAAGIDQANCFGARVGMALSSGRPSACQSGNPPSRKATRACPSQRSSHHRRPAIMPCASS